MTLGAAVERFWEEKGQFEKNKTIEGQLNRLLDHLGEDVFLHHITIDKLSGYQTLRRKDGVSNRTINAELNELLARVYKRAATLWKIDVGEPIAWAALKLPVPRHRIRSASRREELMLLRKLRRDYRPLVRFALLTGLRKNALLLKRRQIDWDNLLLEYPKKSRHTGDKGWLPITPAMERILRREIELGGDQCEWVFTYQCQRARGERLKGSRYPITASGFRMAMQEAVEAAGLEDWRMIHDLRHTAATNTLRRTQNLPLVQQMLGHSDIAQTARYAHVLMEDLRKGMQ